MYYCRIGCDFPVSMKIYQVLYLIWSTLYFVQSSSGMVLSNFGRLTVYLQSLNVLSLLEPITLCVNRFICHLLAQNAKNSDLFVNVYIKVFNVCSVYWNTKNTNDNFIGKGVTLLQLKLFLQAKLVGAEGFWSCICFYYGPSALDAWSAYKKSW